MGNAPRETILRHHSGHDQNALKTRKPDQKIVDGIIIDNISRQHQRKPIGIIGDEMG